MNYAVLASLGAIVAAISTYMLLLRVYAGGRAMRLAAVLLAPPFKQVSLGLLRRLSKKGLVSWRTALNAYSVAGDASIIHLLSANGGCPGPEDVSNLRLEGLYEPITILRKRNCNIPSDVAEEAVAYHVLAGQSKYLEVYEYNPPKPLVGGLYCSRRVVELWTGGETITSRRLPVKAAERLRASVNPEAISTTIGAGLLAVWGCGGGYDARRLLSIVYPEVPPSVAALSYHLGIAGSRAEIIGRAVMEAARIAREVRAGEALGLPAWLLEALGDSRVKCWANPGSVIVTDYPRAACPTWTPQRLKPPEEKPREVSIEAWIAARSLAYRRGDYRSLDSARGAPWVVELQRVLPSYLSGEWEAPGDAGFQVRVEDVGGIRLSKYQVYYDCAGPVRECAVRAGLKPPEQVTVKPRVASNSPLLRGPLEAVEAARELWGGGPTLYVVPSMLAARIAARGLGLRVLEGEGDVEEWMDEGGDAVTSWGYLKARPWVKLAAPRIVLVYPESYPGKPGNIRDLADWVRALSAEVSSLMVSRLAYYLESELTGKATVPEAVEPDYSWDLLADEINEVFSEYWRGFNPRDYQKTVMAAILEMIMRRSKQPVYAVLPTGSGKSAIFQVAGVIGKRLGYGGYTLVVSPLRALMRDQVVNARKRGFVAERIDATVTGKQKKLIVMAAKMGVIDILYVTPERFMDEDFNRLLIEAPPALVVLDEAHTLARWGPSFRPSYLNAAKLLADMRDQEGWPPIALFTATAPQDVVESSLAAVGVASFTTIRLGLTGEVRYEYPAEGALVFRGPVVRPELVFDVVPGVEDVKRVDQAAEAVKSLAEWSNGHGSPWVGVVYTGYVRRSGKEWMNADNLARLLAEKTGIETLSYHGQLAASERRAREDAIYEASAGRRPPLIVVATKAFGMGVDIPNIRWVLHFTASDSIEDYYQEVGRAGRDGREARVVAFYHPVDFEERMRMARRQRTTPSAVTVTYNSIYMLWRKLREEAGGNPLIIMPTSTVYPDPLGLKSISLLQRLGYIDYWSIKATLSGYRFPSREDASDYLPWYMELGEGIVVGPRVNLGSVAERVPVRIARCSSTVNGYKPIVLRAGGVKVSTGECNNLVEVETTKASVMVAAMSSEISHKLLEYLPPDDYRLVVSSMWREEEKVEALHRLLESGVQASRKSKEHVNVEVKMKLEEYFTRSRAESLRGPPVGLLGERAMCSKLSECVDDIAGALVKAGEWLGERGVTLAVQDEEWIEPVLRRYAALTGKPFMGEWRRAYDRLIESSRRGWIHMMDHGFIVLVARGSNRPSILLERLNGYPYHTAFIYNTA